MLERQKQNSGFLASEKIEERFGEKSTDFLIQTAQSSGDTGTSGETLPECGETKGPFQDQFSPKFLPSPFMKIKVVERSSKSRCIKRYACHSYLIPLTYSQTF